MKKTMILSLFLGLSTMAYCGQSSRIELTDGSVINGDVVSLDNGTYTLNAGSLGEIKVDASKIRKIELKAENNSAPAAPAAENASMPSSDEVKAKMAGYQNTIMNDPETVKTMTELAQDPQFQALLNDPQVMDAVKSGNVQALMANPKVMNLMNNSKVKEIESKVRQKNP